MPFGLGTLEDRVWSRIVKQTGDGCWLWQGPERMSVRLPGNGRRVSARPLVFQWVTGRAPCSSLVQTCGDARCVRPDHQRETAPPIPVGTRFGQWTTSGVVTTGADRKSIVTARCSCGFESAVRTDQLLNGRSRCCASCGKRRVVVETGQRFGSLVVLAPHRYDRDSGSWGAAVRCDCGAERLVRAFDLAQGNYRACGRRCPAGRAMKATAWKGIGAMPLQYITSAKRGADERGIAFNITGEQAWAQFVRQGGRCTLTGVVLNMGPGPGSGRQWRGTASLDRIDSSRGYEADNIQWVHKFANIMKNDMTEHEFAWWCHQVVKTYRRRVGGPLSPPDDMLDTLAEGRARPARARAKGGSGNSRR